MSRSHQAFTLIEMLGVLAIMAILSASASIMLGSTRHAADLRASIEQLAQADTLARSVARSSGQAVFLSIALPSGRLSRHQDGLSDHLGDLPGDVKIERVQLAGDPIDFGSAEITVTPQGTSASYAIRLATSAGEKQWVVIAGLSGQILKVSDYDVDTILQQATGTARSDTH